MVTENIDKEICQVLERHYAIRLALLFGSLAKGTAHHDSDLDLAAVPIIRLMLMKQSN